jgi:hypothetical protein
MNAVIVSLIQGLAHILLGSGILDRIVAACRRWADKTWPDIPQADVGAKRRYGVLTELDDYDNFPPLSESLKRVGVELAVQVLKRAP